MPAPPVTRLDRPLRFQRVFLEKVWGGRALERQPGIELPEGKRIGETWELVDRRDANSVVSAGPFEGARLEEVMQRAGEDLLGRARPNVRGRFPLLVKYLDASEALSVQVHPDDETAARLGGDAEGKTEAWYFLGVEPGGAVYSGLAPGVGEDEVRAAAGRSELVPLLARYEVEPGQGLTVRGGTVHAIGAGVTLLEVQQNSNTTYRLYDWDRLGLDGKPRETHGSLAIASIDFARGAVPPHTPDRLPSASGLVISEVSRTEHFAMQRLEVTLPVDRDTGGQFLVYASAAGSGMLQGPRGSFEVQVDPGDVWLLPASLGAHRLEPRSDVWTCLALDANA